ncbi:carbohydrate kinase, partial [Mesorhizobium sp. M4A.F.Ca.ET.022.05.2.1]
GYRRLAELGSPKLTSVRSVGGGAANAAWTAIRQRKLGVDFVPALSDEAAAGTARLALRGANEAGLL